jgi:hypothetical protein
MYVLVCMYACVPCGYISFTVLYVTLVHMYVQYIRIQGLYQCTLGTADRALTHVAHVTTAA